jgi:hypothetical protein
MADPVFTCTISTTSGPLNLMAGPYDLEASSFAESAVQWRKQEVENAWVEGTFLTGAVRGNVTETLAVWVEVATEAARLAAVKALTDALEQLSFTLTFGVDGQSTTWQCQASDYAVRTEQSFRFGRITLVRAEVPRLPTPVA